MGTGFESYHPYIIFSYYIFVGTLAMYLKHPLFLAIACFIMIVVNITHDRGKALKRWIPLYVIMGTLIVALNPFLVSRGTNILFYFRGKQVTLEAFMYGFVMALSIIIILIMFVSFNLVLNGNKFLFIFSKILPRTAFLMMLAIRFVPLLKERFDEIQMVQHVRGISIRTGSLLSRARSGMLYIQVLLSWSLEEAIQTADSMKSRGYGTGRKTSYIPYKMKPRDWFSLLILCCLFLVCLAGGYLGYGKIIIYPELGTLHLYPLDWVVLISMIVLLSFPIIIEGREKLRWVFSI